MIITSFIAGRFPNNPAIVNERNNPARIKLIVNINIENESRLIMNQNYDAGWRIKGKVAESFKGLLSTNVTPSDKTVEFYYLPTAFIIGLTMTLVSIIIVVFSFRYFKS